VLHDAAMTGSTVPLPPDYSQVLADLRRQVGSSRTAAFHAVNVEMLSLYRTVGLTILDRQQREGWGTKAVDRLVGDLQAAFPQMEGLSRSDLEFMRLFAAAWPDPTVAPQVEQLPWEHIRVLLDKVDEPQVRNWYAAAAVEHGWSRDVLLNQIMARSHRSDPSATVAPSHGAGDTVPPPQ
jgi:hypothetical protein